MTRKLDNVDVFISMRHVTLFISSMMFHILHITLCHYTYVLHYITRTHTYIHICCTVMSLCCMCRCMYIYIYMYIIIHIYVIYIYIYHNMILSGSYRVDIRG